MTRGAAGWLLVVLCGCWLSHVVVAVTSEEQMRWEAAEHKGVAESAMQKLRKQFNNDPIFQDGKLFLKGKQGGTVTMHIGELVAATGDFYTHPETYTKSICYAGTYDIRKEQAEFWLDELLQGHTVDEQEWFQIKLVMGWEERALAALSPEQKRTSTEKAFSLGMVKDYSRVTHDPPLGREAEDKLNQSSPLSWINDIFADPGRFMTLSYNNFDHFSVDDCNVKVYRAFHEIALENANKARPLFGNREFVTEYEALRNRAWAAEGMALHYLTDMFAAGHIRTPRAKLKETCPDVDKGAFKKWFTKTEPYLNALASVADLVHPKGEFKKMLNALVHAKGTGPGDLIAKCMHAEDNHLGLFVTNSLGDQWIAYGDGQYFASEKNADNRKIAEVATMTSLEDVYCNLKGTFPEPPKRVFDRSSPKADYFHMSEFLKRETPEQEKARTQNVKAQMYYAVLKLLGYFDKPVAAGPADPDAVIDVDFPDFLDLLQLDEQVETGEKEAQEEREGEGEREPTKPVETAAKSTTGATAGSSALSPSSSPSLGRSSSVPSPSTGSRNSDWSTATSSLTRSASESKLLKGAARGRADGGDMGAAKDALPNKHGGGGGVPLDKGPWSAHLNNVGKQAQLDTERESLKSLVKKFVGPSGPPPIPSRRTYRALQYAPLYSLVQNIHTNYPPMVQIKDDKLYVRDPFSESEMAASGNKYAPTYQRQLRDDPRMCFSLAIICMMDQGADTLPWPAASPSQPPKPLDKKKLRMLAASAVGQAANAAWSKVASAARYGWQLLVDASS